jgi:hypothetical protein
VAAIHSDQSFLKNAKLRGLYLDVNNLPKIPKSMGDTVYEIEAKYENRPDLLASKLYGSVQLWWVFALRNPDLLVDPLEDFIAGKTIFLPTQQTINTVIR